MSDQSFENVAINLGVPKHPHFFFKKKEVSDHFLLGDEQHASISCTSAHLGAYEERHGAAVSGPPPSLLGLPSYADFLLVHICPHDFGLWMQGRPSNNDIVLRSNEKVF